MADTPTGSPEWRCGAPLALGVTGSASSALRRHDYRSIDPVIMSPAFGSSGLRMLPVNTA